MTEEPLDTTVPSSVQGRPRFGSRAALLAGFGTLLILMAITSVDSLSTLRAFENHNSYIRQDLARRENTLEEVRTGVYESGDILSDYAVSESDSQSRGTFRTEFQSIRAETTASLAACIQSLPTDEKKPYQHLAEELEGYWSKAVPILSLPATEKKGLSHSPLRSEVLVGVIVGILVAFAVFI